MSQNPKNESMPSYQLSVEDVLARNNTDIERGLTHSDAQERLSRIGPNALPEQKRRSTLVLFLKQFQSPLIYLLFAAAMIAIFLNELSDAAVILVVVIINSIVGAVQEDKAEKSLESLRKLSKLMVKVRRDGHERQIEARELVPGDILLLGAGDAIGADGRVAEARDFFVAEAALTGESLPVEKMSESLPEGTILADRRNMVYSGTFVTAGRAAVVVVATGEKSEVGKIARLTSVEKEIKTPLEAKVAQFGRLIIVLAAVVFVLIVVVGTLQGLNLSQIFMVGVSQIVSMIPEGLPVAITVALAVGVSRMAERKAIVRKLSAVETLGSTNIICTDKTGTLTKNEMTVREI
ncbi:MAG: HAD-IC family P-type ATPase, partial [Bacteriovoracia bacterium]